MFCTVLKQSELLLPSSNFRSQPFNHKTKSRWNRRHYFIGTAVWLCLADWHLLACYWNSSAHRKQESHTWTGGVIMKLTLVSHLGGLENKGLAREVNCGKQLHTMQLPSWKGGLEHVPRIGAMRVPVYTMGSGLYKVRSEAGDIGPRPDQEHIAGILPDLYLLCSENCRRQPAPEAEAVLETRGCTRVCHDGEMPCCGCASCSSLERGMQIPPLPAPLAKDMFTFLHRCDKKTLPNQAQDPLYLCIVSAI